KKLPPDAAAQLQTLALWLPADGRLLWQLAELAALGGDLDTAAAMLDGCVVEFGLRQPALREHRKLMRAAAEARAKENPADRADTDHPPFPSKPRPSRPLPNRPDAVPLPPVDPKGVNAPPWEVITSTTLDRGLRPTFPAYLTELDGKQVTLTGHMQPIGQD